MRCVGRDWFLAVGAGWDDQMRQSPHLAGFVVESWWSRGNLNWVLRCLIYLTNVSV
ncbi:hypothetical protein EMIT0232MI5_160044 [Pseudomonas sp. IT-232MI5]